jgi:universal stress protein A
MNTYNNILVVVDLSADSPLIVRRAQAIAADSTARITLLHVVEYLPMEPMGETVLPTMQIETELVSRATEKLRALAQQQGLDHCAQQVMVGSIKTEIQLAAQQLGADLIVVGNHARHGLKALLNFTEDAVLHTAPCDVLAVHLPTPARRP